ncbi:Uncharacterized protein BP5553_06089 [Venustampulla echinocandica]|uniref:ML-like domain-containing protein n=1 Tax=Venustampulla echinocandica TaxID=2656787 RepID=A0A370TMJ7_9HELO|nr:Uncharacterized protein BP5553_06089 [Venustampulla echinocandica]RDL36737.1 Uncharacterized protein BP5553_06089 [Venustampulla echinocandica]
MLQQISSLSAFSLLLLGTLPARVLADQILQTTGFSTCLEGSSIEVKSADVKYNADKKQVTFDVSGISKTSINVTAQLNVTAYGNNVYHNSFNPCEASTYVAQLCPVPSGSFSASGVQAIPPEYASMIPSIAFSVPDIAAQATLELKALDTGKNVACVTSQVSNGKSVNTPAVSYIAAGIAGAAFLVTGASALGAAASGGNTGGSGTMSPSFTEVFGVFQGFAMNGMLSVNYPPVYRSFTKNFAFSTGLIPWKQMQVSIDNFRSVTGGNLTEDSVEFLQNATLVYGSNGNAKRSMMLMLRDISTSANTTTNPEPTGSTSSIQSTVSGIKAYAEQLSVPQSNTFMTVLLIAACVIAVIVVGILLFKVILETWALFASFPQKLTGFREHYWGTMARTIVQLILVLYGIWTLYCIFQFTHGDSWAAKLLAGVTLGLFTGVLAFFTFKIWNCARRLKQFDGDASGLYEKKENWLKYSIFYDSYKKDFWWLFVPVIFYMFAKGCVLAAADGHGLTQSIAQLIIEALMLALLVWNRPFERKSGNVINIFIQVVRVLSVICILVFVEELGIAQTTQTVTGVVLIAVQSVLTGVLGILIVVNALIMMCKENPHRKRRKEAEKRNRDLDNLTPLDARNSLLMDPTDRPMNTSYTNDQKLPLVANSDTSMREAANPYAPTQHRYLNSTSSREGLVRGAEPFGDAPQHPTLPNVQGPGGYRGLAY